MTIVKCEDQYGQTVVCAACGGRLPLRKAYADLDGIAFKSYYHERCAQDRSSQANDMGGLLTQSIGWHGTRK